jgi:sortase A
MSDKREIDDLTVDELKELLYAKRRAGRQKRLRRMKAEGRLVEFSDVIDHDSLPLESDGAATKAVTSDEVTTEKTGDEILANNNSSSSVPSAQMPSAQIPSAQIPLFESWVTDDESGYDDIDADTVIDFIPAPQPEEEETRSIIGWRPFANRLLLIVEVAAVISLIILAYAIWQTTRELNQEIAEAQGAVSASLALPTPAPTPVIGVVVLPSGHKPPVNGQPPERGEAGDIPAHLLPILNAYVPPPIPTPGPEQARRIQIPAIDLDKPIVQGDNWEELKKGVGQHVGSSQPGENGNIVLSAHNDIYGEIFRYLDQLAPGDEIVISTERQSYTYIVRDLQVVQPTDVWVMGPTEHSSSTLISCYPYLVNNKRIVVFADLAATNPLS